MSVSLLEAARSLRRALSGFDAALLSGDDAARVADELAKTEKVCAAALAKAAARVTECEGPRALQDLARQAGKTPGQVRHEIDTVVAAGGIPELGEALDRGELSLAEGAEIAKTEAEAPGSAADLLETARRKGLRGVRDEGRRRRQAAMDEAVLDAKRKAARSFHAFEDELGMTELRVKLLPQDGTRLVSRVEAQAQRRWLDGDRDSTIEQRLADALVDVVTGTAKAGRGRSELVVVADLDALTRGHAEADEPCHVVGGPRLSVDTVKALAGDAIVSVVLHDGEKVDRIVRYGRGHLPAALRILLEIGEPPHFVEACCTNCSNRFRLQLDHIDPVANGGETSEANLQWLCPRCHPEKTETDRLAGLLGPTPTTRPNKQRRAAATATTGADPP